VRPGPGLAITEPYARASAAQLDTAPAWSAGSEFMGVPNEDAADDDGSSFGVPPVIAAAGDAAAAAAAAIVLLRLPLACATASTASTASTAASRAPAFAASSEASCCSTAYCRRLSATSVRRVACAARSRLTDL
jgi:hypothetical protein